MQKCAASIAAYIKGLHELACVCCQVFFDVKLFRNSVRFVYLNVLLPLTLHLLNKVKTVISSPLPPSMNKLYPANYHVIYPAYRG
jgi:hypothetical protein